MRIVHQEELAHAVLSLRACERVGGWLGCGHTAVNSGCPRKGKKGEGRRKKVWVFRKAAQRAAV